MENALESLDEEGSLAGEVRAMTHSVIATGRGRTVAEVSFDMFVFICALACSPSDRDLAKARPDSSAIGFSASSSGAGGLGSEKPSWAQGASDSQRVATSEIARLRAAASPDRIDSLIAEAVTVEGQFYGDDEEYGFTGSEESVKALRSIPGALPRLLDCLGWDKRARATYNGARVLAGVVCYQGMAGSPRVRELSDGGLLSGVKHVDYRNPPLEDLRESQSQWRKILREHPQ